MLVLWSWCALAMTCWGQQARCNGRIVLTLDTMGLPRAFAIFSILCYIMFYYILNIYIHIHINYACSKYSLRSLSLYWSTQSTRFQSFMNLCEAFESPDNYLVFFLKPRAWQVDLQWSWQRLAWRIILLIIFKLAWLLAWASSILEHGGFEA